MANAAAMRERRDCAKFFMNELLYERGSFDSEVAIFSIRAIAAGWFGPGRHRGSCRTAANLAGSSCYQEVLQRACQIGRYRLAQVILSAQVWHFVQRGKSEVQLGQGFVNLGGAQVERGLGRRRAS